MLADSPHRRYNPLTREWVLVSPHRTQRPWQGQMERTPRAAAVSYDADCYLCPGNERSGGKYNPRYTSTFVFDNDFPALKPDIAEASMDQGGLLVAGSERGLCRVVCFTPDHGLTIPRMEVAAIRRVVDTWTDQYAGIGALDYIRTVQIFENRGEMMGASNPHPHCQIWSSESIPTEIAKEDTTQQEWLQTQRSCLLCDYLSIELRAGERLVCENQTFAAVVPFWAVWPFEILLVVKRHASALDEFTDPERDGLAEILKRITTRYDNLFEAPFPYTMGLHQRPVDGGTYPHFHFHAHYYPPLLRSATVRKFMVGFEMLGSPQRDITPETAAERLRAMSEIHYANATGRLT